MSFDLSAEDRELHDAAVRLARESPVAATSAGEVPAAFDRSAWLRCAEFGVPGMPAPPELGGGGLSAVSMAAVLEGLGYGGADQGLLFSLNAHLWTAVVPILRCGTEEQRRELLPRLCDGTWIAANGASEPDAGSDVFSMRTRARRRGAVYVVNGRKTFVTNAPIADLFVVYVTIDPSLGPMGITCLLIDAAAPGIGTGSPLAKMGLDSSPMSDVVFEDVEVPVTRRLGREGRGVQVFEDSMTWERGMILAGSLGTMRRLLERCVDHARGRKQFGRPIGQFQSVAHRIADMRVRLETCRLLIDRVARLKDAGEAAFVESAIAKLHVSESWVQTCRDAMQVFGGYGYMKEYGLERELRDALASTSYSGTTEIQRSIVARDLGLGG